MILNLPNILSLSRLIIAPIFFFMFLSDDIALQQISIILFLIGSLTDYFDGYLARKYKVVSSLGKFLDPLADKFLTSAAFLAFYILHIIPFWMVLIILIRDFGTTFLRVYQNSEFQTSYFAKIKTTLQLAFIAFIETLFFVSNFFEPTNALYINLRSWIYSDFTYYSMLIITLITVWTLVEYIRELKFIKA